MDKRTIIAVVAAILFFLIFTTVSPFIFQRSAPAPVAPAAPVADTATTAAPAPAPATPAPVTATPVSMTAAPPAPVAPVTPAPVTATPVSMMAAPALAEFPVPAEYAPENVAAAEPEFATDRLTVRFTTATGSIKSVVLNDFENFQRTGKLELLKDFTTGQFPTEITRVAGADIQGRAWRLETAPLAAPVSPAPQLAAESQVAFATVLPSGIKVTKIYTLYPGKYGIGLTVRLDNLSAGKQTFDYEILGPAGIPYESYGDEGTYIEGVLSTITGEGNIELKQKQAWDMLRNGPLAPPPTARTNYAGASNRYFASAIRPSPNVALKGAVVSAAADSERAKALFGDVDPLAYLVNYPAKEKAKALQPVFYTAAARLTVGDVALDPAGGAASSVTHSYLLYAGPKDRPALMAFNTAVEKTGFSLLLNYGWFEPIVKLILYLLKLFHAVIPNWGIAIILLTLLMRLIMHPLTRKSQVSMAKMQKLQPRIKELQKKYKDDKQKLGVEQMKLMKEGGANPFGGCLPILIQMPIFFALYKGLMISIELRQQPFFLWIKDMTQPDMLITWSASGSLPVIGNQFNLLPILMAAAMVIQQKMSLPPATPEAAQQQKIMMMFMPFVFGLLLYKVAAGLNLYILTSTVGGAIEQWVIKRHLAAQEAAGTR